MNQNVPASFDREDMDWLLNLTPEQMNEGGCYRLISAVVKVAIDDTRISPFIRNGYSRQNGNQARMWVASDSEGPRSFNSYCRMLGINPEKAQGAIMEQWREG